MSILWQSSQILRPNKKRCVSGDPFNGFVRLVFNINLKLKKNNILLKGKKPMVASIFLL